METNTLFLIALGIFALCTGINKFIPNEVIATIGAIAGIVTGIVCFVLLA